MSALLLQFDLSTYVKRHCYFPSYFDSCSQNDSAKTNSKLGSVLLFMQHVFACASTEALTSSCFLYLDLGQPFYEPTRCECLVNIVIKFTIFQTYTYVFRLITLPLMLSRI